VRHAEHRVTVRRAGLKKLFMGGMVARTMTAEVQALDKVKAVLEA